MSISPDTGGAYRTLILGSATVDVVLEVERLPKRIMDMHADSQRFTLGGCACNVFGAMRRCGSRPLLAVPIGTGPFAQMVREALPSEDVILFSGTEENGCCYCFVEPDGERTFLSVRGAEYRYRSEWLRSLPVAGFKQVYVCGIDLEEPANGCVLDFLEANQTLQICFAPGPRLSFLPDFVWERLWKLHPLLHLNAKEARMLSGRGSFKQAAERLFAKTQAPVIITCGEQGSMGFDGSRFFHAPAEPVKVTDTIGAGDAHAGACLHALENGEFSFEMLRKANQIAAMAVQESGALAIK